VGRPRDPSSTEYLYVTVWDDVESIRAFAGERWQEAVITPDEEHLLKDTWIGHYEVLPTPDQGVSGLEVALAQATGGCRCGGIGARRGGLGWCSWRAHWSVSIDP
jgi:hypothetical protein